VGHILTAIVEKTDHFKVLAVTEALHSFIM